MTDRVVSLTIDGQKTGCPEGSTIYEAATQAGIHIPTFCHHEKLVPVGACRMCLVEIEGVRGLQTSCSTLVREGMVVKVHTSAAAVKARKANIEFLLTNHPLDCPVCDKGGECPLQDQALVDGPGQSRYGEEKRHKNKRYPLSDLIVLDQERCVLCWRCIRFLDEWAGDHQLDLFGRGADTRIDTYPDQPLSSKWQGNTIDICPVGALTSRVFRFEARVWELSNTPSICPMCSVGCNLLLGTKNNRLRRITPLENLQVNDSWLCDKGRFTHGYVDHPDRLQTPLIRRQGQLEAATWDEALDLVAERLTSAIEQHGPQSVAGLGSARVTNEANYLLQRFVRSVIGSNNVDHVGRMPVGALPLSSLPELEDRDVFLLLGFDPSTEAPLVELWIKKAILRHGATVIVANPRRIELVKHGGPWLGHRPGSEAALLNGLARAMLDAGLEGQTSRVTNVDDYHTWLRPYGPKETQHLAGVQPQTLLSAAQILAQAENPIAIYGPGWTNGVETAANLRAVENLCLLLGGMEAGFVAEDINTLGALEMGVIPDLYPGGQSSRDNRVRSRLAGLWGSKLSPVEGLDFEGMMSAGQEGDLQAMWIVGADPAHDCSGAGEVLGRIPFVVVQDLFMTDAASLAEVVLPAASYAEIDGCFTNLSGRFQAVRAAKRPPGQARADWWIIAELAKRMVDEKRRNTWDFASAGDVLGEISRAVPVYRGLDYAAMGEQGWQSPAPSLVPSRTFVRVEPSFPPSDPDYPLALVVGRLLYDRGTLLGHAEQIQGLVPDGFVMIHPTEAEALGLSDGDSVSVVSMRGRLGSTVKVSDKVVPGVAFMPRNLSEAPLTVLCTDMRQWPRVRLDI